MVEVNLELNQKLCNVPLFSLVQFEGGLFDVEIFNISEESIPGGFLNISYFPKQ